MLERCLEIEKNHDQLQEAPLSISTVIIKWCHNQASYLAVHVNICNIACQILLSYRPSISTWGHLSWKGQLAPPIHHTAACHSVHIPSPANVSIVQHVNCYRGKKYYYVTKRLAFYFGQWKVQMRGKITRYRSYTYDSEEVDLAFRLCLCLLKVYQHRKGWPPELPVCECRIAVVPNTHHDFQSLMV